MNPTDSKSSLGTSIRLLVDTFSRIFPEFPCQHHHGVLNGTVHESNLVKSVYPSTLGTPIAGCRGLLSSG